MIYALFKRWFEGSPSSSTFGNVQIVRPSKSTRKSVKKNGRPMIWKKTSEKPVNEFLSDLFYTNRNGHVELPKITIRYLSNEKLIEYKISNVRGCTRYNEQSSDARSPFLLQITGTSKLHVHETAIQSIIVHEKPVFIENTGCFSGNSIVTIMVNDTESEIPLEELKPKTLVKCANGKFYPVKRVTKSSWNGEIFSANELKGSPYHPVVNPSTGEWIFMNAFPGATSSHYAGFLYNMQLHENAAEAVLLNGIRCAVLGHGVTSGDSALAHPYFGNWVSVDDDLANIRVDENGHTCIHGAKKDPKSGLVSELLG